MRVKLFFWTLACISIKKNQYILKIAVFHSCGERISVVYGVRIALPMDQVSSSF